MREYKVILHKGSVFLGSAEDDARKMAKLLNGEARRGWRVISVDRENASAALFFKRKTYTIVLERDLDNGSRRSDSVVDMRRNMNLRATPFAASIQRSE